MMHKAWSSIEEVPYCFSRSYVKFQGHTALKIVEFDPNWAFPDCNSSLNSPMAMKCCTKLETAKERCPIVFQGHPSNFKVTRYKTSPILTQIGRFRTIGRSQLSNPSDLPCLSFHSRWMLKDMNYHFFSSLHDIFPSCAYVQVVYVFISIVQSIFLSIILPFCHWWPLRPKTQLIEHCHVKQLGDIFESIITHKLSLLHYTKTSY